MQLDHPSIRKMWKEYLDHAGISRRNDPGHETWYFCDNEKDADELAKLVLAGQKRGTTSCLEVMIQEGEPVPKPGDYSVVTDWKGVAVCVIKDEKVSVVPFDQVTEEFAAIEGEGDGSLEYWKKVHHAALSREMSSTGLVFHEETPVICEEFSVVYPGEKI